MPWYAIIYVKKKTGYMESSGICIAKVLYCTDTDTQYNTYTAESLTTCIITH